VKKSLTKVADFDKITVQSNYDTKHYEVPPDREVEEQEDNREEYCDDKGSISFLLPAGVEERQQQRIWTKSESKTAKRAKYASKLNRRQANAAGKRPATAVAMQLNKLKEESVALINEIRTLGWPTESLCKMIEDCDRQFEENIESIAKMHESANEAQAKRKGGLDDVKEAELSGRAPSAAYDTAATSSYGVHTDPFIRTGRKSDKIFRGAMGHTSAADDIRLLEHDMRDGAREVHMVPGLSDTPPISAGKLVDEWYVSIFDKDEVNVYDANSTEITVSWSARLKGWRSEHTGLCRIPLRNNVDENRRTKIQKQFW